MIGRLVGCRGLSRFQHGLDKDWIRFRDLSGASELDSTGIQQNHHGRMVEFTVAHAPVLDTQQARQFAYIRLVRALYAPAQLIASALVGGFFQCTHIIPRRIQSYQAHA